MESQAEFVRGYCSFSVLDPLNDLICFRNPGYLITAFLKPLPTNDTLNFPLTGQIPGPGSMMPGQPIPGRMIPAVGANIHPSGGGPAPPGMPPMPGNILGPRVPLTAPNGMCKYHSGEIGYTSVHPGGLETREALSSS